jgi:putative nucleotidyltransferase with HDIG domain
MEIYNDIRNLYTEYGNMDYIGESVSQLEHAMQCANSAYLRDASVEVIIAALLHDIGHLLGIKMMLSPMVNVQGENIGIMSHESIGANYLRNAGFSEVICKLVANHVNVKRYLCGKYPDYLNNLSYGSTESLKVQGGPMNNNEIAQYEKDPLFLSYLLLRDCDDSAKEIGKTIDNDKFWDILRKYIINRFCYL